MYFNSAGSAEITVSRIDTLSNSIPTEPETVFDSQYWVVDRFGTGTFNANLTFILDEDLTGEDEADPDRIELYTRASNSDGDWSFLTAADSVDAAADMVTFTGLTEFSQFIIGRSIQLTPPQNLAITVDAGQVNLTWEAVPSASSYLIFMADEAYPADWGAPQAICADTNWSTPFMGGNQFFQVTASTEPVRCASHHFKIAAPGSDAD